MLGIVYLARSAAAKPSPFQLVLKLSDDNGGDQDDKQTFETLHARFERQFPRSGKIGFEGFDTEGSFIWFYFFGPEEKEVRRAVLSQLQGCKIRKGSYFSSKATEAFAAPDEGQTVLLGESTIAERDQL